MPKAKRPMARKLNGKDVLKCRDRNEYDEFGKAGRGNFMGCSPAFDRLEDAKGKGRESRTGQSDEHPGCAGALEGLEDERKKDRERELEYMAENSDGRRSWRFNAFGCRAAP